MANRTAYDSADPVAIPSSAKMVLWYLDGAASKWTGGDLARFRDAVKVSITVVGSVIADIADVENEDLTIPGAVDWIRSRGGHRATVYIGAARIPELRAAAKGLHYDVWAADWTGTPHPLPGCVAVQYASPAQNSGGEYDLTEVHDDNWYPSPVSWQRTALLRAQDLATASADLAAIVGDHQ
jgi:hypothetical protein